MHSISIFSIRQIENSYRVHHRIYCIHNINIVADISNFLAKKKIGTSLRGFNEKFRDIFGGFLKRIKGLLGIFQV